MRPVTHVVVLLFVLLFSASNSYSQSVKNILSSSGTEFWLGFMPNFDVPAQNTSLYVTSSTANSVKVEVYGGMGNIVQTLTAKLSGGSSHKFDLNVALSETRTRELATYRAIRVTSEASCTVYGYSKSELSSDGFLVIPKTALGREYYCLSYYDDPYTSIPNSHLGGEMLIVAPYDSTLVSIKSAATTTTSDDGKVIGHQGGDEWSVMLMKGQTYLVQTTGNDLGGQDLTGSKVTSNRPIAFLSGHQRAGIGNLGENSKDHLIEMLPSTEYWGTEYFDIPHQGRTQAGNYYRIVSAEAENQINDGHSTLTLPAGRWIDVELVTNPIHFKSLNNKRFFVMQYSYHEGYMSDPAPANSFMTTLPSVSSFVTEASFTRPSASQHVVTLLSTSEGIDAIRLGHALMQPQLASTFSGYVKKAIDGTTFAVAQLIMPDSIKTWVASSPIPFGIYLYGYNPGHGYGYPAAYGFTVQGDTIPPVLTLEDHGCGLYDVTAESTSGIASLAISFLASQTPLDTVSFNYDFRLAPDVILPDSPATGFLSVIDPSKPAQAVLYAQGKNGLMSYQLITYTPQEFSASLESNHVIALVGDTVCQNVVINNPTSEPITFDLSLQNSQSVFTISPASVTVSSFSKTSIKLCFTTKEAGSYSDSLIIAAACNDLRLGVSALSGSAEIQAEDANLDTVAIGTTICETISITNTGVVPIEIIGTDLNNPDFTITDIAFPLTLAPGETVTAKVCFEGKMDGDYQVLVTWKINGNVTGKRYSQLRASVRTLSVTKEAVRSLTLNPNPATDWFEAQIPTHDLLRKVLAIDEGGRTIALPFLEYAGRISVDVSSLPSGAYMVRIEGRDSSYNSRLVINR